MLTVLWEGAKNALQQPIGDSGMFDHNRISQSTFNELQPLTRDVVEITINAAKLHYYIPDWNYDSFKNWIMRNYSKKLEGTYPFLTLV